MIKQIKYNRLNPKERILVDIFENSYTKTHRMGDSTILWYNSNCRVICNQDTLVKTFKVSKDYVWFCLDDESSNVNTIKSLINDFLYNNYGITDYHITWDFQDNLEE